MNIMMEKCHICEECGMAYFGNKKLCECDKDCKKSDICDIEEIRYSLKLDVRQESPNHSSSHSFRQLEGGKDEKS